MSVNSFTEWGKLKEVVVGSVLNTTPNNIDLSFRLMYNEHIKDKILQKSISLQQRMIEQRNEDLDGLADLLKSLGVKVHRPRILENIEKFNTPDFEEYPTPADNPRDLTLIVGNEIIETSSIRRRRYFENDLMKHIFLDYFNKGAKWTVAPRPRLVLNSYDLSSLPSSYHKDVDWDNYANDPAQFEIFFDAAQCLRFGKDIVMNVSNQNHILGAQWLQRHLGEKFRIHTVKLTNFHIDGMFMPLRPGVLLINPNDMKNKMDLLPKALQSWDTLIAPEESSKNYPKDSLLLASSNIPVNVLPLDEERVLVFDELGTGITSLMKTLEKNKFIPIPVRLRHSRVFDGGLHCVTLDTVRDDQYDDFFT